MQPGVRVTASVVTAALCISLLGVTPAPLLTAPLLIAGLVAAAVTFWHALGEIADELDENHGPLDDPAQVWGVAGWPAPHRTDLASPTRAERRQLIAEIEEYLSEHDAQ